MFLTLKGDRDSTGVDRQKSITFEHNWFIWKIIRYFNTEKLNQAAFIKVQKNQTLIFLTASEIPWIFK